MKKVIGILIFVLCFSFSAMAQKEKRERMSIAQQTELAVKKMTLKLDLTPAQQSRIKPLLAKQMEERQAIRAKRKALKEKGQKPTADERYAMMSAKLDKQIAFKADMKRILDEKQYERFEKMANRKMHKMKRKRKRKMKKDRNRDNDRKS